MEMHGVYVILSLKARIIGMHLHTQFRFVPFWSWLAFLESLPVRLGTPSCSLTRKNWVLFLISLRRWL